MLKRTKYEQKTIIDNLSLICGKYLIKIVIIPNNSNNKYDLICKMQECSIRKSWLVLNLITQHNAHKGTMVYIENPDEMMQNALSHQDLLCFVFFMSHHGWKSIDWDVKHELQQALFC